MLQLRSKFFMQYRVLMQVLPKRLKKQGREIVHIVCPNLVFFVEFRVPRVFDL